MITRPQLNLLMTALPLPALILCLHIKPARKARFLVPILVILTAGIGLCAQTGYIAGIPTVKSTTELICSPYYEQYDGYMPDEPSTFRLTDDLPKLDGATALYPVYAAFYRAAYPEDAYWPELLRCSRTACAYKSIIDGTADIIFVAEASKAQTEAAKEKGVEPEFIPLGSEAFIFLVYNRNPLDDITPRQILDIYTGRITKWEELGVKGMGSILPYRRTEGSGSRETVFRR